MYLPVVSCPGTGAFLKGPRQTGLASRPALAPCSCSSTFDGHTFPDQRSKPRGQQLGATKRVLRYPGGQQRILQYPSVQDEDADALQEADEAGWELAAQYGFGHRAAQVGHGHRHVRPLQQAQPAPFNNPSDTLFSTHKFLTHITSPEYRAAQAELWKRVRSSYQVLQHGCPWVVPRPLHILSTVSPAADTVASTYTLRTLVRNQHAEDELSKVLGKSRADGTNLITFQALRDGVIAFEDELDAERYASYLEADGHPEVSIAQCDSHAVFRTVQDVHAVVVYLERQPGVSLPLPDQLAISLRGKKSLEEIE